MTSKNNILITGGCGFIGSHLIRLLVKKYPNYNIVNLDLLTYAGNKENVQDVEHFSNYNFVEGDICDPEIIENIFSKFNINRVIHLAAESHVDRSIEDPLLFVKVNVIGTSNLLNCARKYWENKNSNHLFYHISTDEVYGSLGETGLFSEQTPYDPRSPYSASKASSDHMVRAYAHTYGLPVVISNCSNNYGPNQYPEKLIPLFINNIVNNKALPVYGDGKNIRDWLYVKDHVQAIDKIFHEGRLGQTYNIGGLNEWTNIDLVKLLIQVTDEKLGRENGHSLSLIQFVEDRAGHDLRYAIDATKLKTELDWSPTIQFEEGLSLTVDWYLRNEDWLNHILSKKSTR